jgi:hypothetical protein
MEHKLDPHVSYLERWRWSGRTYQLEHVSVTRPRDQREAFNAGELFLALGRWGQAEDLLKQVSLLPLPEGGVVDQDWHRLAQARLRELSLIQPGR